MMKNNNITPQFFESFMNKFKGGNADIIIDQIVSNGFINQRELNMIQNMANGISNQFSNMKQMFNFKN